jgi:polyferredoxin
VKKGKLGHLLKYNTPRRIVQFLSFVFFSVTIFNIGVTPLLLPVLWTWGLGLNVVGDAFTAVQLMLGGWNLADTVFPWLAIASFLVVGVLIGKSLCGWICPFGFVQDLVGYIRREQTELSQRNHETMLYAKYLILGLILFISISFSVSQLSGLGGNYSTALGILAKAPFTALSPGETLFATLPKMIQDFRFAIYERPALDVITGVSALPPIFWVQIAILIVVLISVAYIPRSWCRYFCPHGAIMAILNRFSLIGLRREPFKCAKGECRACVEVCPTRVHILDQPWEKFSDPECIYCMKCVDACPNKALRLTYP